MRGEQSTSIGVQRIKRTSWRRDSGIAAAPPFLPTVDRLPDER